MDKVLSIIIPVYNTENYIADCIESITCIKNTNIEVIIVNDGSTDSSLNICKEYALVDQRIKVIDKKNEGVSIARNIGLSHANGKYILFLDSDDFIKSEFWKPAFSEMEKDYDLVLFNRGTLYENGRREITPLMFNNLENLQRLAKIAMTTYELNPCWGKLYKRKVIEENNIRFIEGMRIGEDTCFTLDFLPYVKSVKFIDVVCVQHRIIPTSAMHKMNIEDRLKDIENTFNRKTKLLNKNIYNAYAKTMYYMMFKHVSSFVRQSCIGVNKQNCYERLVKIISNPSVLKIIDNYTGEKGSIIQKMELLLYRKKMVRTMWIYYKIKNTFIKLYDSIEMALINNN
jgi:glycosyltransferase involved in cell wall biosynthesis